MPIDGGYAVAERMLHEQMGRIPSFLLLSCALTPPLALDKTTASSASLLSGKWLLLASENWWNEMILAAAGRTPP